MNEEKLPPGAAWHIATAFGLLLTFVLVVYLVVTAPLEGVREFEKRRSNLTEGWKDVVYKSGSKSFTATYTDLGTTYKVFGQDQRPRGKVLAEVSITVPPRSLGSYHLENGRVVVKKRCEVPGLASEAREIAARAISLLE